ncbi:MAG: SWI/SNF complex component snf12 [Trizodia sp. TS-e1964]|nr:MAG: SWI/SNF complex component snf12 [Trizodia sp. TS-e1964]
MNTPHQSSQYRGGYPQQMQQMQQMHQRSPHASASRRGQENYLAGQMIPPASQQQATMSQAHMIQQHHEQMARDRELAKRRSRKPTDKNMPAGVEDIVVGDGVQHYKSLRDIERRLDAVMMKKRLDIQDSVNRNVKTHKTLRVWISNTAENQPWQTSGMDENAFDFSTGVEATYRVKIEGRLLEGEDSDDADSADEGEDTKDIKDETPSGDQSKAPGAAAAAAEGPKPPRRKQTTKFIPPPNRRRFSHFFKGVTIEFDGAKSEQPDGPSIIEWRKPLHSQNAPALPPSADFDSLEFERKSDENLNCTINFIRDEIPERFQLSKELAAVLDTTEDTRAAVVMGIWEYIKAMGLQEDEERRAIRCDDLLRAGGVQIFKRDQVYFPEIPELVLPHLSLLPPIKLPYTIRVDAEHQKTAKATIYDIQVPFDDPLCARMASIARNPQYQLTLHDLGRLDDTLADIVQAISHSKAKHAFFSAMGRDPGNFINRWMSSQKRDLEVILGEAGRGGGEDAQGEEWRRGGASSVWNTQGVRESVTLFLATKGGPKGR